MKRNDTLDIGGYMDKSIEELTLLLLYLTSWEEHGYGENEEGTISEMNFLKSWKSYQFDVLNELGFKGYLYNDNYRNKSVTLTKKGEELAKKLKEKYLKDEY